MKRATLLLLFLAGCGFSRTVPAPERKARWTCRPLDLNLDGQVNARGWAAMTVYAQGPGVWPRAWAWLYDGCGWRQYRLGDFDGDGDVDLRDMAVFQRRFVLYGDGE